ncbi:MAG TPA: ABC transporter permease [Thermomicrobiales bacterium]
MRAALVIAFKDLRQRLRDRSLLIFGILAPLGLTLILNSVLGGTDGSFMPKLAVFDEDQSEVSRTFVEDVLGQLVTEGYVEVTPAASAEDAENLAEKGDVSAAVIVPAGFGQAVNSGQPAEVRVVGNPDSPIGRDIARSIVDDYVREVNGVRLAVALVAGSGGEASDPAGLAQKAVQMPSPVTLNLAESEDRQLDTKTYVAAGMAVFFLFFTVRAGVMSLLEERRQGTLARLLAAPISSTTIVVGKSLASFGFGLLSMAALVIASTVLLDAHWGDPIGVAALSIAAVIAAMGITSLVASVAKTEEQAVGISSTVAVVLGTLGGSFFPVSQGPAFLAKISLISPHGWLLRGFGDLAGGGGVGDVVGAVLAVLAFGVVTGGIAVLMLRSRGIAR